MKIRWVSYIHDGRVEILLREQPEPNYMVPLRESFRATRYILPVHELVRAKNKAALIKSIKRNMMEAIIRL